MTEGLHPEHELELAILAEFDRICAEEDIHYQLAYGTLLGAVRHQGFIPWDLDVDVAVTVDEYPRLMGALRRRLDPKWVLHWHEHDPDYDQLLARIGGAGVSLLDARFDIFPVAGLPTNRIAARIVRAIAHATHRAFFFKKVNIPVNYADRPKLRRLARPIQWALAPFPASFFVRVYRWLIALVPFDKAEWAYNVCGSYGARERVPASWIRETVRLPFEGLQLLAPREWDAYLKQMYGDYLVPKVRPPRE